MLKGHERGVATLAWVASHRLLFSGGFASHELLVWNPLSETVICTLRGHTAPLVKIVHVVNTPQLVSADLSGVLMVWDVRSLACAQTMQIDASESLDGETLDVAVSAVHKILCRLSILRFCVRSANAARTKHPLRAVSLA